MWIALCVLLLAVIFYAWGRLPVDLVSAGLLTTLIVVFQLMPLSDPITGINLLDAPHLLQGFSHPALITVVALLVVGEGVTRTGALSAVAPLLLKLAGGRWQVALALSLLFVAGASAFLNNAPVVVIFIPILATLANNMKIGVSKLLMPLSFASILGGTCTLIGTSTNILVAEFARENGLELFEMFTFSALGLIVLGVGLIYLILLAPRLLPDQGPADSAASGRPFLAQLEILPDSPLVNRPLGDAECQRIFSHVRVRRIFQGGKMIKSGLSELILGPGDLLLLVGSAKDLKQVEWDARSTLVPAMSSRKRPAIFQDEETAETGKTLAEVVIPPESSLVGRTLSRVRFHHRFGPSVIGIQYDGRVKPGRITERPLRAGDLLLIQGFSDQIDCLSERDDVMLFWGIQDTIPQPDKARVAIIILAFIVLLAATHTADMLVLSLTGAFLMLASRCLSLRQAYNAISPQVVLVVAATLALGEVMQISGAAQFLAHGVVHVTQGEEPFRILSLFIFMVMVLTNIISNNASAILFAPIAISIASFLGVSPVPFLMGVVFGANAAFATPMGYKTNLLVMGAGSYGFGDFMRVGLPLNLLMWILVSLLIPHFWPF